MVRIILMSLCAFGLVSCGPDAGPAPNPARADQAVSKPRAAVVNPEVLDRLITHDLFASAARYPDKIDAFLIDKEQTDGSRCYYASSYVSGSELAGVCVGAAGTFHDGKTPMRGIDPALAPYKAYMSKFSGQLKADEHAEVIVARLPRSQRDVQISLISKRAGNKGADIDFLKLTKATLGTLAAHEGMTGKQ